MKIIKFIALLLSFSLLNASEGKKEVGGDWTGHIELRH